jgi:hypothetical protein
MQLSRLGEIGTRSVRGLKFRNIRHRKKGKKKEREYAFLFKCAVDLIIGLFFFFGVSILLLLSG